MGIDAQMFVKIKKPFTPKKVNELAYALGCSFGPEKFWIFRGNDYGAPQHALEIVKHGVQDGPDIIVPKGCQLLEVHPCTRYYGEGYERGDLPFLVMLAEWLERNIPDAQILYGGDSGGVCAEPFGPEERKKAIGYWANTTRTWLQGFSTENHGHNCEFCNAQPMTQYSFSGNSVNGKWICRGCGYREDQDRKEVKEGDR